MRLPRVKEPLSPWESLSSFMCLQFLSKGADLQQDLYKAVGGKVPALK